MSKPLPFPPSLESLLEHTIEHAPPSHVPDLKTPCKFWLGTLSRRSKLAPIGYAQINRLGKRRRVHRITYELATGLKPVHKVLHKCDRPYCINPDHLWDGTDADNQADRIRKGRLYVDAYKSMKITEENVIEIKYLSYRGESVSKLAAKYNVSRPYMSRVINSKRRKNI